MSAGTFLRSFGKDAGGASSRIAKALSLTPRLDNPGYPATLRETLKGQVSSPNKRRNALALKRIIDLSGALLLLVTLSPVLIFLGIWITAVSRSTPIFRQKRVGRDGRMFSIYKFKTIQNRHCDPSGRVAFTAADARLLPLGWFLRTSRLDETPQLINILRGEMSLVGPRPHVPNMLVGGMDYGSVAPLYARRTAMTPGLTGWAQCNGAHGTVRTPEEAIARVDLDLAYLRDFSITLDLKIMAKTVFHVFAILKRKPEND